MASLNLDMEAISKTIDLLCRRIEERFPGSGLSRLCRELDQIAAQTRVRAVFIARPIHSLRVGVALLVVLVVAALGTTAASLRSPKTPLDATQVIQLFESSINDLVLVGAGIFFLTSFETRIKRNRALRALRDLRAMAHLVDMHQLTKDPEWVLGRGPESALLPPRRMTRFELSRYLDYCSEMLALTGKIAAVYVQDFDDDVAVAGVNEVEELTTGLSRKIWQKLMILYSMEPVHEDAKPLEAKGDRDRPAAVPLPGR